MSLRADIACIQTCGNRIPWNQQLQFKILYGIKQINSTD